MSTFKHSGVVTSIAEHYDSPDKFMRVHVKHGPKPKKRKGKGAGVGGHYDNRPESTIIVPKAHASKYRVGQSVGVGLAPHAAKAETDPAEQEMDSDEDDFSGDQNEAEDSYRSTMRGIISRPKAKTPKPKPKGSK
jgi:hypothetical protein